MIKIFIWRICCLCSIVLSFVAFTPLVIPSNTTEPFILGMPRTLWLGILISIGLIILTVVGALVVETDEKGGDK